MKDIHDTHTADLWPAEERYDPQLAYWIRQYNIDARREGRIRDYLREKPYLREALRRTVK